MHNNACFLIITLKTAQQRSVFNLTHKLQVLIQETGDRRALGIGVVWKYYENSHFMPGWFGRTVGYHAEDGKIFHPKDPYKGKEVKGNFSRAFHATYLTSTSTQGIRTLE